MIVTVSWPRPDGTTNYKCCSIKLSQQGHTFLCECLAPMFVPHVLHETTICMSGVCVRVRAALSTVKERSLMARPLLGRFAGIGNRPRGCHCGNGLRCWDVCEL